MRKIIVQNLNKIKKAVPLIEDRMKIKVSLGKGGISLKGPELEEFLVEKMIRAVDFGFSPEDVLLLKNEDFVLEFIDIKSHTHRKNMRDIRARLIGTGGKARKTIEKITGAVLVVHINRVGVIVDSEHLEAVTQGIESLIQGAKHGNVFSYLEKQNISKRKFDSDDLGLKEDIED